MKATVHIGMEKTGTTSVQRFVREHQRQLANTGILVPKSLGPTPARSLVMMGIEPGVIERNHRIAGLTDADQVRAHLEDVTAAFRTELRETSCERVLLTNELLSNRLFSDERINRFGEWLRELVDDVEILVYLRRQDRMLLAMYSTLIKVGFVGPFEVPTDKPAVPGMIDKYDYASLLAAWGDVFGKQNICVRVFEPGQLVDGDVVIDFAHQLGVPELAPEPNAPRTRENESLDLLSLEFLRRFNRHVPYMARGGINPQRSGLLSALEQRSAGRARLDWSSEVSRADFMNRFAAGNADVARTFLGRDEGVLFVDDSYDEPASDVKVLDADVAVEIASQLWLSQQRRIRRLESRLEQGKRQSSQGQAAAGTVGRPPPAPPSTNGRVQTRIRLANLGRRALRRIGLG